MEGGGGGYTGEAYTDYNCCLDGSGDVWQPLLNANQAWMTMPLAALQFPVHCGAAAPGTNSTLSEFCAAWFFCCRKKPMASEKNKIWTHAFCLVPIEQKWLKAIKNKKKKERKGPV